MKRAPEPSRPARTASGVLCTGSEITQQVGIIDFTQGSNLTAPLFMGGQALRQALTSNPPQLHLGFRIEDGTLNEGDTLHLTNLHVEAGP